mmetsp:Transcript_13722/g.16629  ORF Transcript_13722/g.16629 Transcript_13722/m.16629 type:complete len:326 (-) Transcript_13722:138-1115(-)|eukprot:CAMPEP_0184019868 /NCGR_PEP_ID=MMETSP0954-20121128/9007_1 /TAXON_ID=627963 /ORGANISM="Aplanochytrium sp, Strain PBS07" /LENGTH=325 /DNA_ID=CAMNT_0026301615 /DNA_START=57 /DNA_END=1034 /DNA_ORIENTATION=+
MGTISNELERKLLVEDLLRERESDEDGGPKARFEIDSDFSWESEEENAKPPVDDAPHPDRDWSKLLTRTRSKHNTGPKGVKADYEEAKRIVRRQNETKVLRDQEYLKQTVYASTTDQASISYSSTKNQQNEGEQESIVKDYDADEESDDDEKVLLQMRKLRLQQLREAASLPQFGRPIEVGKFEFLDQVDNADPRTPVVVHLYEDYLASCRRINELIDRLAQKHPFIKFLKLKATEADQTLSHKALPAFMVYKNGNMVNEAGIKVERREANEKVSESDLEWLFASKYGINIPGLDISSKEKDTDGMEKYAAAKKATSDSDSDFDD